MEDGLLFLTGGLSREMGVAPSPDVRDALWDQMMEWWTTSHVIGCEHRVDGEPSEELIQLGLLPNTPYCVVTGGEPAGAGRMVRLRTFHGFSEWRGKWSDEDSSWTNHLRNLMHFRSDGNDGTFWMSFDDFTTWFNVLFVCRMADDRWTRLTTRSSWAGATAGGCCPNYASWRSNPQWLLRISKPTTLMLSLSTPLQDASDAGSFPLADPDTSIGISVLRGNTGADARRRKLFIASSEELLVPAEPRPVRRLVTEVSPEAPSRRAPNPDPTFAAPKAEAAPGPSPHPRPPLPPQVSLEPSAEPYVIVPHTYRPGRESAFTLIIRSDDTDDDGVVSAQHPPHLPSTAHPLAGAAVALALALALSRPRLSSTGARLSRPSLAAGLLF